MISFPDFNECISDGETVEEAIANGFDALAETIAALEAMGLPVPEPGSGGAYSGRFVVRLPKSLHARLAQRAQREGVSMNTLVVTLLAEGLAGWTASGGAVRERREKAAYLMEPAPDWKGEG